MAWVLAGKRLLTAAVPAVVGKLADIRTSAVLAAAAGAEAVLLPLQPVSVVLAAIMAIASSMTIRRLDIVVSSFVKVVDLLKRRPVGPP